MLKSTLVASNQSVKKQAVKHTYTSMPDHELIGQEIAIPELSLKITKASCQDLTGKVYLDKTSYTINVNGKDYTIWVSMQDQL